MCLTPIRVSTRPLVQTLIQYPLPMQTPGIAGFERDQHVHFQGEGIEIWGESEEDLPGTLGSILGTRSCRPGKGRSMSVCRVVVTEPAYHLCLLPHQRSCHCPPFRCGPEARRGKLLPQGPAASNRPPGSSTQHLPPPGKARPPPALPGMWQGAWSHCPPSCPTVPRSSLENQFACDCVSQPLALPGHECRPPAPAGAGVSSSVGGASAPSASKCWQPEAALTTFQVVLLFIHPFVYPRIPHADRYSFSTPCRCLQPAAPVLARGAPDAGQMSVPRGSSPGAGPGPGAQSSVSLAFPSALGAVRAAGARSAERRQRPDPEREGLPWAHVSAARPGPHASPAPRPHAP